MSRVASEGTRAITSLLDGGFLQLYAKDGTLLAQMRFDYPAFGPIEDGRAEALPLMVGVGRADGVPNSWVALTSESVPVLAGEVLKEKPRRGVVVDGMLTSQNFIAAGAEVRVASFTYRQEQ